MTDLAIARLLDRSRWSLEPGADRLTANITIDEARLLSAPGPARTRIEHLLHELTVREVRGMLAFIRNDADEVIGFLELRICADGKVTWDGPHGPTGTLFVAR